MILRKHIFLKNAKVSSNIRGLVNIDLLPEHFFKFGLFIAQNLINHSNIEVKKITVGIDTRASSPKLAINLMKGILTAGLRVINLNIVTTPIMQHFVDKGHSHIGLMITASHNNSSYNGIKVIKSALMFFDEYCNKKCCLQILTSSKNINIQGLVKAKNITTSYIKSINPTVKSNCKLKILWDCRNGSIGTVIKNITSLLPECDHVIINTKTFISYQYIYDPINEKAYLETSNQVSKHCCDIGISFDCDGDRIMAFDKSGKIIPAYLLAIMLIEEKYQSNKNNHILTDIYAPLYFLQYAEKLKLKTIFLANGQKYFLNKLNEETIVGVEYSSHLYQSIEHKDDAVRLSLVFINIVLEKGLNYLTDTINIINENNCYQIDSSEYCDIKQEKLRKILKNSILFKSAKKVIYKAGYRLIYHKGWIGLRLSQTENKIIIKGEALELPTFRFLSRNIAELKKLLNT